ncbi:MAG: asparagine synthase (glutamine-hydrolyzing) [Nitrospirae bacterium]|nr:asparagine synthase (glutamine-hydrolyzing) [Nitrospirota bacterium]
MCGIVGFTNTIGGSAEAGDMVKDMLDTIRHRGPDDRGLYVDHNVTLGQTRLAILDLTSAGRQPMTSHDERYLIVFNGEVYNFKELRIELEARGYKFKSNTDTEVILYCVIEYGVDTALHKFNGMFAFCIYDKREGTLLLARDRIGVKPLYYYADGIVFAFCSELKALHAHPAFTRKIDVEALSLYLQYGYIRSPYSIFEKCRKLQQGHYLLYDIAVGTCHLHKYWGPPYAMETRQCGTFEEHVATVEELLHSSVKYRLISDVPVGVFLSGGIDSSLIAALMAQHGKGIDSFTIGFNEREFSEAEKAKTVAKSLGTRHHELYCSLEDAKALIPKLPSVYDEPFADPSAIPTLLLSEFTKNYVKVALSGDGGDELFGGYNKYKRGDIMALYKKIPMVFKHTAAKVFRAVNYLKKNRRAEKIELLLLASNDIDIFKIISKSIQKTSVARLLNREIVESDDGVRPLDKDFLNSFMLFDLQYFLEGDIMAKVDRASMSASIEAREPLLDYRLVDASLKMPSGIKFSKGPKSILKEIAYKYIDRTIIDQPKHGFNVPIDAWLKNDLSSLVNEYIDEKAIKKHGLFDTNEVISLKERFFKGKEHAFKIWNILSFQMWYERWN